MPQPRRASGRRERTWVLALATALFVALLGALVALANAAPATSAQNSDMNPDLNPDLHSGPNSDPNSAFREEPLSFDSGELTLHGTVLLPESGSAVPGMVLVHGAGPGSRDSVRLEAEAFASRGVATLIYDKRTEGYSLLERSYSLLAGDALAAATALAGHPQVDASAVGLWGVSEGAWVVPLATAEDAGAVAFAVLVAATGVPPARQHAWFLEGEMRRAGIAGSMLHGVATRGTRYLVAVGLFSEAHHDPLPPLVNSHQPLLALWGEEDRVQPPRESLRLVEGALAAAGNERATLVVLPGGGHGLRKVDDGALGLEEGYPEIVANWVGLAAAGAAPPSQKTGPEPSQAHDTRDFPPLAWWEAAWVQLALVLLVAGGLLLARARLPLAVRSGRLFRLLAAASIAAVGGHFFYLNAVLVSEGELIGAVVAGRAVVWLLLQLALLAAVVAGVALAFGRGPGARGLATGWPALGVVVPLLGWALYWGLALP